ncbi:MAG: hypothetical protein JXQ67_10580 [Campylobacterales bacterium]|nr:hypothetical protein [Campylobacterales bacterium]
MKTASKIKLIGLALLASSSQLSGADWLTIQGSEPEFAAPEGIIVPNRTKQPKIWGFIQANYRADFGTVKVNPAGINQTPFSVLNPNNESQSGFNVFRARLAARGMLDDENKVNYFVMTEFGNNGVNNLGGHSNVATYLTDASITLKHVPYANIRLGRFKYPGSEEGLQAVFVSPYVSFTTMTNQQMLERSIKHVGAAQTGSAAGGAATTHYTSTSVDNPIGAFRDTGVELFDTFKFGDDWSTSYAYMYGNGTGLSNELSGEQATHYGYLALEQTYGGKGYFTEAMKFYIWGQTGKRQLLSNVDGVINADRLRYGLGMTYYNYGLRFELEYMKAKGMIFTGPKDVDTDPNINDWQFQYAIGDENEADGGYVNLQYEIVPKKVEVFGRFDFQNRLTNDEKAQRNFTTTTIGTSYRFKGATRLDVNYLFRDVQAPGNVAAQTNVLDNMGDRLEIQVTAHF